MLALSSLVFLFFVFVLTWNLPSSSQETPSSAADVIPNGQSNEQTIHMAPIVLSRQRPSLTNPQQPKEDEAQHKE